MDWKSKLLIGTLLLSGAFLGGLYTGRGQKEVQVVEKEGRVVTVWKDRIVTVTKTVHKDGTITETTKTEEKSGSKDKTTHEEDSKTTSLASDYSLGLKYWATYADMEEITDWKRSVEVTAGRRLLGGIWLDAGLRTGSASLGVSVKW